MDGRFLAEITKEVISELESQKHTLAEYRMSIYGKTLNEWEKLAIWFQTFEIHSKNV